MSCAEFKELQSSVFLVEIQLVGNGVCHYSCHSCRFVQLKK